MGFSTEDPAQRKSPTENDDRFLAHRISPKSYGKAVVLGGGLGIFGVHFFYIGRPGYGIFDLTLSFVAISMFFFDQPVIGIVLLAIDFAHSVYVTFRLLTGMEVDGQGRRILYPGQKLKPEMEKIEPI